MKEKLLNNLGLKVVSLVLAFVIWMAIVNISNPVVSGQPFTIPVDVRNEEILDNANLTYEIVEKDSVTVNYQVNTRNSSLFRASDFSAYIDLKDYNDVTGAVPITIEVNKNKESLIRDGEVTAKPMVLHVKTEAMQNKKFDLKVNYVGEVEDGYASGITTLSSDYVVARGPESVIGQIASIGVEISREGANADLEGDVVPKCYDANDKELTDLGDKLTITPNTIHYNMAILKAKELTLNFEVKGTVAPGYRFTGVDSDLKSVPVVATKSVLASVNALSVADDKLTIEGATADKVIHLDLNNYLPPSTAIVQNAQSEVTVTLKVEPLTTKSYTLNLAELASRGTDPDYEYTFSRDSVDVNIRGLKEDLDTLDVSDLNAVLDMTGLEPGTHPGKLAFEVGEGFEVVNYSDFDVMVVADGEDESEGPGQTTADQGTDEPATAGTSKKAAE